MNNKEQRSIEQTWAVQLQKKSEIHTEGFLLPPGDWKKFDPFLLMGEVKFQSKAFGHHPHRGIETVSYVIDGTLYHEDNKGGRGILNKGDAQWMTAGSGLTHLEAPPEGVIAHTLQLWVNLPKVHKMATPRYQDILSKEVPVRKEEGVTYRVYSGNSGDIFSPTKNYVPVSMVEIAIDPGFTASQDLPSDFNGFIYILEGSGIFGNNKAEGKKGEVMLLNRLKEYPGTSEVSIKASDKLRVLFFAGKPLNEPVAARGPFVMNTKEEIDLAYSDYKAGKF